MESFCDDNITCIPFSMPYTFVKYRVIYDMARQKAWTIWAQGQAFRSAWACWTHNQTYCPVSIEWCSYRECWSRGNIWSYACREIQQRIQTSSGRCWNCKYAFSVCYCILSWNQSVFQLEMFITSLTTYLTGTSWSKYCWECKLSISLKLSESKCLSHFPTIINCLTRNSPSKLQLVHKSTDKWST